MRSYAKIDLGKFVTNLKKLSEHVKPARLILVVKADGYGHGAYEIAKAALKEGYDFFAVAFAFEGVELRKKGIEGRILILNYISEEEWKAVLKYDLIPTIYDRDSLNALLRTTKKRIKVHVGVDTGMGRLGYRAEECVDFIKEVMKAEELEGLYTHFATAGERDKSYTRYQYSRFSSLLNRLKDEGIDIPLIHTNNSAAAIDLPEYANDYVRVGIATYGLYPSEEVNRDSVKLEPILSWYSTVSFVKTIHKGESVGYGREYIAKEDRKIATITVGYADGYSRALSNKAFVLIRGKRCPVVGRVSMDQITVDVSEVAGVDKGDECVLIGKQGGEEITADEIAKWRGTVNYEVLCNISKRVPRIYVRERA